jgi:hypothetical protein
VTDTPPPTSTGVSPVLKYWVLAGTALAIALLTYFSGHPDLTEATAIGAALIALPLVTSDFEAA